MGRILVEKIRIQLFVKSFVLQVYDVLARHRSRGFESLLLRHIKELCTSSLPARTRQTQAHALGQKDLVSVFGTPSIVSEVLSGKREMNKDHIKRLSARFHVSPELFF